jgi:hypothetical protein
VAAYVADNVVVRFAGSILAHKVNHLIAWFNDHIDENRTKAKASVFWFVLQEKGVSR